MWEGQGGGGGGISHVAPVTCVGGSVTGGCVLGIWHRPSTHRGLTERRILPSTIQDQSHHSPRL